MLAKVKPVQEEAPQKVRAKPGPKQKHEGAEMTSVTVRLPEDHKQGLMDLLVQIEAKVGEPYSAGDWLADQIKYSLRKDEKIEPAERLPRNSDVRPATLTMRLPVALKDALQDYCLRHTRENFKGEKVNLTMGDWIKARVRQALKLE